MQIQTLVSALTFTGLDTLSVLRQMEQHSTVHKDIILEAYHGFPSAPEMSLDRMKSKITLPEFKLFVNNLKQTISDLSMVEAFSDLITDRETISRLRRISIETSISNKADVARILMIAPMILLAISTFLYPIGYLGGTQFYNTITNINL